VLGQYADMPQPLVWLAFVLFCILRSLHWAAFCWLAGYLVHSRWALLSVAALWTGLERVYGPFGFAWLVLGNAGIEMGVPMRLAPLTGVYGLSFTLAAMSVAVALLILRRPRRDLLPLAGLVLLYVLPAMPGIERGDRLAIYTQANIEESTDWTEQTLDDTIRRLATHSLTASLQANPKPDLILWPEVPAPFYYNTDTNLREQIAQLARLTNADVLLGGVGHSPRGPFNSAFHVGPDGNLVTRYDKMNLVPFGEYTPGWFAWVGRVTEEAGSFVPGARLGLLPLSKDNQKAGVFICYESVFPHFVRQYAAQGATVLVNLSNDGYFGRSAARAQHLLVARMRAAENRRWMLRATNDGITATIDPAGRVDQTLPPFRPMGARTRFAYLTELTPYTRNGDWFVWGCLGVALLLCVLGQRSAAFTRSA